MAFWDKLVGTVESWFGLGGEETVAVGRDVSGNLVFKDEVVVGTKTLTELSSGGDEGHPFCVDSGNTLTVNQGRQFDHLGRFCVDGRKVIDGRFVLGIGVNT